MKVCNSIVEYQTANYEKVKYGQLDWINITLNCGVGKISGNQYCYEYVNGIVE